MGVTVKYLQVIIDHLKLIREDPSCVDLGP